MKKFTLLIATILICSFGVSESSMTRTKVYGIRLPAKVGALFGGQAYDQGIYVFPGVKQKYLVRRVELEINDGSWLLYIDVKDPRIIRFVARTMVSAFQGEGEVWKENPLTTPKRTVEILNNLDATHTLSGSFARVYNGNFQEDTSFPLHTSDYTRAKTSDRKFNYGEDDARVTEAMAYYHINIVHDRWASFGFKGLNARAPIFVNISAFDGGPGFDNAYYRRAQKFRTGIYVFGGGDQNNNNGLDAEILYHEYGHGVLDHINPGFLEARDSNYPLALHEAFGDISAAAISQTPRLFDFADRPRNGGKWTGRNMSNHNRFPKDVVWKQVGISEPHHTGLILDGAWWDLQKKIGALPAQQLIYEAVKLVPAEVDFFQIRDAMLTADESINGGRNSQNILSAFAKHGLSGANPGQKGTLNIKSVVVAAYSPSTDYQLTSQISRGQIASIVVQYEASGLAPGYNLVPEDLRFDRPAGSNAFIVPKIDEVKNGSHLAVHDALHIFEIPTYSFTTPGTYTIHFTPRLGGTNRPLAEQTVTFEVH
jgi:hypothetical protein